MASTRSNSERQQHRYFDDNDCLPPLQGHELFDKQTGIHDMGSWSLPRQQEHQQLPQHHQSSPTTAAARTQALIHAPPSRPVVSCLRLSSTTRSFAASTFLDESATAAPAPAIISVTTIRFLNGNDTSGQQKEKWL